MEPKPMIPYTQRPREHEEPAGPASCPVCGGPTVPLRGMLRCLLCCFVLCEQCEGVETWQGKS
jgi:hypothetical protein